MTHLVIRTFVVGQPVLKFVVESGDLLNGAFFGGHFGHFVFQPTSIGTGPGVAWLYDWKTGFPSRRLVVICVRNLVHDTPTISAC